MKKKNTSILVSVICILVVAVIVVIILSQRSQIRDSNLENDPYDLLEQIKSSASYTDSANKKDTETTVKPSDNTVQAVQVGSDETAESSKEETTVKPPVTTAENPKEETTQKPPETTAKPPKEETTQKPPVTTAKPPNEETTQKPPVTTAETTKVETTQKPPVTTAETTKAETTQKPPETTAETTKAEITQKPPETTAQTTETTKVTSESTEQTKEVSEKPQNDPPDVETFIDFEQLHEVNEDIYAWIEIEDTIVDYPILQNPTNDKKYLNAAYDGSYSFFGSIFTEATYNNTDFNDPVTVMYGHSSKSGKIFGSLKKLYSDSESFKEHSDIKIYLPGEVRHYTVFAAVPYDNLHILYNYDFSNNYWYKNFFKSVLKIRTLDSNFNTDIVPEPGDRVIILSTCYDEKMEQRYLVMAINNDDIG